MCGTPRRIPGRFWPAKYDSQPVSTDLSAIWLWYCSEGKYIAGSENGLAEISDCLSRLVEFYPRHIVKEDKHFFFPCLDYFSQEEQDKMLQEFWEFDRQMIHEKYTKLVEEFLGPKILQPGKAK